MAAEDLLQETFVRALESEQTKLIEAYREKATLKHMNPDDEAYNKKLEGRGKGAGLGPPERRAPATATAGCNAANDNYGGRLWPE